MRLQDINTNPDSKTLRQFAGLCLIVFGAIGGWQWNKGADWGLWLLIGAGVVGGIGLIWPKALKPIFVTWMILAFPIGWVVSHTILALIFFGCFFPLGLILRMRGHNSLKLTKTDTDTYWLPKTQQSDPTRYLKQF